MSEYPPKIGGISDYAAKLAQSFETLGEPLHTIVTSNRYTLNSTDNVSVLPSATGTELLKAIEEQGATAVLLHFSGYGFARWGLCYWLVEGLRAWKENAVDRKCVILFHEVYATGPIWRASCWTAFPQKQIAKELAKLSDAAFVTSQGGYSQLKPLRSDLSLEILPVFSTVGDPQEVLPLSAREDIAVVFGGARGRDRVYKSLAKQTDELTAGFNQLGITEILDIGPGSCAPKDVFGFPVRTLGTLPEDAITDCLQRARVGLIDYPLYVLTKSTIQAAYFAHGLLTINTNNMDNINRFSDDLKEGKKFIHLNYFSRGDMNSNDTFQFIATNAHQWYEAHSLQKQTKTFYNQFNFSIQTKT